MRTQQDKTKQNRLVLPMGQTVFLPQTAMGVSYIDKVRTKVYIDNLQRQEGQVCLRGFYEIDLEYHGLEGQRLYKHRVMLPLRAELPDDWLLPLEYEADELHAVISQPMLRILSPYVLEFSGQLVVEYVGDLMHRFEDEHQDDCDEERSQEHSGRRDYHLPYIYQMQNAEAKGQPEEAEVQEVQERLESKYHLPVWQAQPEGATVAEAKAVENEGKYHLPVWSAQPEGATAADAEAGEIKVEAKAEVEAAPVLAVETAAEPSEEAPLQAVEASPATKTVATEGVLPSFDGAERSKMRSLLTSAAISRLQAKGEKLIGTVAEDSVLERPANVVQQVSAEPVQEVILISEGEKEMTQLTAVAAEQTAAQPVEAASKPEAELVAATSEEVQAVEAAAMVDTTAATDMAKAPVSEAAEGEPEPVMAEAAEREVSPAEAASELAEAAAAAAEANEAAEAAAEVEAIAAEQPMNAFGASNLVNANGVRLRVGLREPAKILSTVSSNAAGTGFRLKYYVVKPGDDPMSIALQHNVPLESLRAANQALAGDLSVGMVLRIPS